MASENPEDGFASDYWQRRPGLNFDDSESSLPAESSASKDKINIISFDYVHFVKFIALRSIPIIKYEHLVFTIGQSKTLGSGAAMQVCMATWKTEVVAVKQIRSQDSDIRVGDRGRRIEMSEKWLNDLYFELQIMSHQPLCEHPNIVQLKGISFDETSDALYPFLIVEPACEDHPDLTRLVQSSPQKLPADQVADIIGDIADGISALHVYGVIHGDIKPDNILIFPSAERSHGLKAKICDFGFSGSLLSEDLPRGTTPAWAAPEFQYDAPESFKEYRQKAPQDIYSFALVAMFILLGRPPIMARDLEASKRIVSDLHYLLTDYPWLESLIPVFESCLEYYPAKRRPSLADIRELIVGVTDTRPQHQLWDIAMNPFRRDLSHEADESKIINFSLHNASFIRRVFPSLPKAIQENLIKQVQDALQNETVPSHRMLAIYRTLRTMQPDLPAVEGTDPSIDQNDSDFSRLLLQSHQALSNLTENMTRGPSVKDDSWLLDDDWSGMTKLHLKEFVLLADGSSTLSSPETLLQMKDFRSKRGFGYLTAACRTGNTAVVKALLAMGISPNEKSDDGHTPLHAAVVHSHHECAQLILAAGADTEALMSSPMSSHYTALVFASSTGDAKMTELLLKNGANIWHRILDSMQNTVAHTAANGAMPTNAACLKLLLEKDPRLALAKNSHQRTPLHHAAGSGDVAAVKALLHAGADPNALDVNRSNPLHITWFSALDLVQICSEYFPEKLQNPALKVIVQRSALISSMDHLRPLEVVELLLQAGADPKSLNIEDCDAKSSAYLNMLIALRIQIGDVFSSYSVGWSMTPFSPWYSSFPYRNPWITPLSWIASHPGQALMSNSAARMWFLDVSPVSPLFGYYLTISMAKFHESWNDAALEISVYSWKRHAPRVRSLVEQTNSKPDRLLHFNGPVGSLVLQTNFLYNFSFGKVTIADPSDIMVEFKLSGASFSRGGLILGTVQFHLEPDFDLRAINQLQPHPNLPDVQIIKPRDGEEPAHVPELSLWYLLPRKLSEFFPWQQLSQYCIHWHKPRCPDYRDFDLNGVFLTPQRASWLVFIMLCTAVQFAISVRPDRWWRCVLILFVFSLAGREKFVRRAEIFPAWKESLARRGYGTIRKPKERPISIRLRIWLAVILDQEQYWLLVYCFFHDFRSAGLILAGHVLCCFVARKKLANEAGAYHVLCPLGLEMELCLIIFITQVSKAISG